MNPFWLRYSLSSPRHPWINTSGSFQAGIAEGLSQATSQAASTSAATTNPIASNIAQSAGAAFSHPPPPPPPSGPHYPHPYSYSYEAGKCYRRARCGPRLFPVLLIGGVSIWGYAHLKHSINDLKYEVDSVRAGLGRNNAVEVVEPVREERFPRRRWGNRWGEREAEEGAGAKNQKMA